MRVRSFGGPEEIEAVEAPLPKPGRGEVRVRVLASSLEYTDVVIRRHLYIQTMLRRAPLVMGYDVVGEIDALGEGVTEFAVGDRVADLTVVGSNAAYRTLRAKDVVRVPPSIDAAEAATLILSWTTAYQLLHRVAHVRSGQPVLVLGAAGAVGQALLVLGKMAGVELFGSARAEHAPLIRSLGATPLDYKQDDITRAVPHGFDVVFDGIGEDAYRHSFAALAPGGLLVAYGYSSRVQTQRHVAGIMWWLARAYLSRQLLGLRRGGKHTRVYSINVMRARHPEWFREDLGHLFDLLAARAIWPRIAARVSFEDVSDAHRRLEAGGLEGKLVLVPELSRKAA